MQETNGQGCETLTRFVNRIAKSVSQLWLVHQPTISPIKLSRSTTDSSFVSLTFEN